MWHQHSLVFCLLLGTTGAWLLVSHPSRRRGCTLYPASIDPEPSEKKPRPSPTGFSFVEGGVYTNERDAIEAMGGDPFFLEGEDNDSMNMLEEEEGDESSYFDG
jgi:hypothetical protein